MRTVISRWTLFGLLLGRALTHATVCGQTTTTKMPAPTEKLRAGLDKVITIDYSGPSLIDALNQIRDKSGLPITVDQMLLMQMQVQIGINGQGFNPGDPQMQFQVKATGEKTSKVLHRLLNAHQLTYVLFEDSVMITMEEIAAMRQYRQRVSVDVTDVPLKKAVGELAKTHGIPLVFDPKFNKQAEAQVTLQLDNATVETALRMLAELAEMKAVR